MHIPDPLAGFAHGPLHRLDIRIAEAFTGVPRRSISRHAVEPAVSLGVPVAMAIALFHWLLIVLVCVAIVGVVVSWNRRSHPARA